MEFNCLRHPIRSLRQARRSLAADTLDANLRCARDHAARGNPEGFHRHCGHARDIAEHHFPDRVSEVEQVVARGPAVGA